VRRQAGKAGRKRVSSQMLKQFGNRQRVRARSGTGACGWRVEGTSAASAVGCTDSLHNCTPSSSDDGARDGRWRPASTGGSRTQERPAAARASAAIAGQREGSRVPRSYSDGGISLHGRIKTIAGRGRDAWIGVVGSAIPESDRTRRRSDLNEAPGELNRWAKVVKGGRSSRSRTWSGSATAWPRGRTPAAQGREVHEAISSGESEIASAARAKRAMVGTTIPHEIR